MVYGTTPNNKLDLNTINWICVECAHLHDGKQDMNHLATFHEGICDVCDNIKAVTEPRDFVW